MGDKHHTMIVWHSANPIILAVDGFLIAQAQNIAMDILSVMAFKIITTTSAAKWNVTSIFLKNPNPRIDAST